jgi:hypothetical protein
VFCLYNHFFEREYNHFFERETLTKFRQLPTIATTMRVAAINEFDGLSVMPLLRKDATPLVAFVTAYDE